MPMEAEPRRIAFLVDSVGGPVAGTERQLWELLEAIDRRRYEPELVLLRAHPTGQWQGDWPCGVTQFSLTRLLSAHGVRELLAMGRHLSRRQVRLVHAFFPDALLIAPILGRMCGARVVTSRRDMGLWHSPARLLLARLANRFVDRVVANSQSVADYACSKEGLWPERVEVIHNGVRLPAPALTGDSLRARLGIGAHAPVVGIVANLRAVKRHGDLIRAMRIVRGQVPEAHLVLIGKGGEEEALRQLAATEQLGDRVHFLGRVADPAALVSDFTVGVLCSESEGLSNALIEYLQAGIPAVCTDVGGNPEIVTDGRNGFLVPVGDVQALAERIVRVLRDPALAGALSENARKTGRRFSVENMVESHLALYDAVLEGPGWSTGSASLPADSGTGR